MWVNMAERIGAAAEEYESRALRHMEGLAEARTAVAAPVMHAVIEMAETVKEPEAHASHAAERMEAATNVVAPEISAEDATNVMALATNAAALVMVHTAEDLLLTEGIMLKAGGAHLGNLRQSKAHLSAQLGRLRPGLRHIRLG
jgi:hypothetical protein